MGAHKPDPLLLRSLGLAETMFGGGEKATRKKLGLFSAQLAHSTGGDTERLRHVRAPEAGRARAVEPPVEESAYTATYSTQVRN